MESATVAVFKFGTRVNQRSYKKQKMETYFFKSALVEIDGKTGWHSDVSISVNEGMIVDLNVNAESDNCTKMDGVAIPAMVNVHSHAFQRGFAGLSEYETSSNDSFWTWRKLMYDFVSKLSPDDVYVIARQLYLEMLRAGYSWVGEFHYLHNDDSGKIYSNRAEMADAVCRAAADTGIGICLLPVLYQRSGFNAQEVNDGQKRFALTTDQFLDLVDLCQSQTATNSSAKMGIAFHSLRAVSSDTIKLVLAERENSFPGCPVHIHVAEQTQEVDDCLAATGKRPVEFLLSQARLDQNWCLIHATHLNSNETIAIAKSGAVVGLCPTTEANLGDGFFPASEYLDLNGSVAIGSDSHCSVDVADELRTLEYGQRLKSRKRALLGDGNNSVSVGRHLFQNCAEGGGQGIGVSTGRIEKGHRADFLIVDDNHATIAGAAEDRLLDRFVFVNTGNPILARMIGGRLIENDFLQAEFEKSLPAFLDVNQRLNS
jgi:formimidoylglutamate deiminase